LELLIGAGSRRDKGFLAPGENPEWNHLVALDINPDHKPDVVWDLTKRPLPFDDNTFDSIRAFEVLEHLGQQGDYRAWFDEWSEWWRILKPNGHFIGTSPDCYSRWAWGDPGHTRIVSPETMTYLDQDEYTKQVGVTPITDYRFVYKADFNPIHLEVTQERKFIYVLQAIKPSRISIR
jgi:SAM-dependent methyltransferase